MTDPDGTFAKWSPIVLTLSMTSLRIFSKLALTPGTDSLKLPYIHMKVPMLATLLALAAYAAFGPVAMAAAAEWTSLA